MAVLAVHIPQGLQDAYDVSMDGKIACLACIMDHALAAQQQKLGEASCCSADIQYVQYTFCKALKSSCSQVLQENAASNTGQNVVN